MTYYNDYNPCNLRISATEEGLERGWFFANGLSMHVHVSYTDHSVKTPQGSGWVSRHGYKKAELIWDSMTPKQANALRSRVEAALQSNDRLLYMTIPRADGTKATHNDWIDISGKPDLSNITPMDGFPTGVHHQNVALTLNDITILNDPAEV